MKLRKSPPSRNILVYVHHAVQSRARPVLPGWKAVMPAGAPECAPAAKKAPTRSASLLVIAKAFYRQNLVVSSITPQQKSSQRHESSTLPSRAISDGEKAHVDMTKNSRRPFYAEYAWAFDLLIDRPVRKNLHVDRILAGRTRRTAWRRTTRCWLRHGQICDRTGASRLYRPRY